MPLIPKSGASSRIESPSLRYAVERDKSCVNASSLRLQNGGQDAAGDCLERSVRLQRLAVRVGKRAFSYRHEPRPSSPQRAIAGRVHGGCGDGTGASRPYDTQKHCNTEWEPRGFASSTMFPVIPGKLYRSSRPGYEGGAKARVGLGQVQALIDTAKSLGIASIICILDEEHLCLYPNSDLLGIYLSAGFEVRHIAARDHSIPPLTRSQLDAVLAAYRSLPKPVLIHCSAGLGRTGVAWAHILDQAP